MEYCSKMKSKPHSNITATTRKSSAVFFLLSYVFLLSYYFDIFLYIVMLFATLLKIMNSGSSLLIILLTAEILHQLIGSLSHYL